MAKRKIDNFEEVKEDAPDNLKNHPFFGIKTNPEQTIFRDAIWNPKNKIIFCDSVAGSGKTLISTATAVLLVKSGLFSEIVCLASPINADKEGFLPGDSFMKGKPYFEPFFQALRRIGVNLNTALHSDDYTNEKNGTAFITCMTDTYIRGLNIGEVGGKSDTVFLVEEASGYTRKQLVRALTRVCEGSKVIVSGHHLQCDLKDPSESGFVPFLEHFRGQPWCEICTLTENYRGDVSRWADQFKG